MTKTPPIEKNSKNKTEQFETAIDHLLKTHAGSDILRQITTELLHSPHHISHEYWKAISIMAYTLATDDTKTAELRFNTAIHKARSKAGM